MREYEIKTNVRKTKLLRLKGTENVNVTAMEGKIQQVQKYKIFSHYINGRPDELKIRIFSTKEAFNNKKNLFCSSMDLRLVRCSVVRV